MKKKSIFSILFAMVLVFSSSIFNIAKAATGQDVVNYAKQFIGTRYVWGGTTTNGFDCSGFVQYVYKNSTGINLPRTTYEQVKVGSSVSRNNLQPGDLVFPDSSIDHVCIYIGNGKIIHASSSKGKVVIAPMYGFYTGRRILSTSNSYIKIDGGGTLDHNGDPAINLIIRDYSDDVVRAFGWVDSDSNSSWAFDVNPPNNNYTKLYKGTNKVISSRNNGNVFSPGAFYKITVRGYNKNFEVVCESTLTLRAP